MKNNPLHLAMKTYKWVRNVKDGSNLQIGEDYVELIVHSKTNIEIYHHIKKIRGWHQYDFEILAFLLKELYD